MDELIATAARVGGLYAPDGRQVGFARVVSDVHTVSYLADVYVLDEARGRGFGLELVRFTVDEGPIGADEVDPPHARHAPPLREARLRRAGRALDGALAVGRDAPYRPSGCPRLGEPVEQRARGPGRSGSAPAPASRARGS